MAHARRKFHELHLNQRSEIAEQALVLYGELYDVEREAREQRLDAIGRQRLRQQRDPDRSSAAAAAAHLQARPRTC